MSHTEDEPNRLQIQMARMISLTTAVHRRLERLNSEGADFSEASDLLADLQTLIGNQKRDLESRLSEIAGCVPDVPETTLVDARSESDYPLTAAMEDLYAALHQLILGYSLLHAIGNRFRDSVALAPAGTTAHLAQKLQKACVEASQRLCVVAHKALIWELESIHEDCHCTCAACSSGLCVCARTAMNWLNDFRTEAGPINPEEGIYLYMPRAGSNAEKAGIVKGDVLLNVMDGVGNSDEPLQKQLQAALKQDRPYIRLKMRRTSGKTEVVIIKTPDH